MKNICVFCGSSRGYRGVYAEAAAGFAEALAQEGLDLVYGGANIGLMKVVADKVLEMEGKVYGVMPRDLAGKEIAHEGITEMHIVETMSQRKERMAAMSDAFVVLPGGVGTLDELFEVLSWNQLGIMKKPVGILNVAGFYDHLVHFLEHALEEKFLRQEHSRNLVVEVDPGLLIKKLRDFRFTEAEEWVERLKIKGY
ncbi:MAG: TIGR00730 family Rossman fold protein [Bacteroidetes bacterium]|nr:TIGR00730 family Rossman fold protein [Bacteroidota bacterium]